MAQSFPIGPSSQKVALEKNTMSDDFEDLMATTGAVGNDEDIGALESILSWNEEDDDENNNNDHPDSIQFDQQGQFMLNLPLPTPVDEFQQQQQQRNYPSSTTTTAAALHNPTTTSTIQPPYNNNNNNNNSRQMQMDFNTIMQQQAMLQRLQQQANNPNADPKMTAQLLQNMANVFVRTQGSYSQQQPVVQPPQVSQIPPQQQQPTPQPTLKPPPPPTDESSSPEPTKKKRKTTKSKQDTTKTTIDNNTSSMPQQRSIVSASDTDDKKTGTTGGGGEENKVQANRDRNREHARNTRLRKKQYLEKLKKTVDELCRERDTLVSERAGAASLLVEMHNTRTEVLMSFFILRSANEKRRNLWASILDEASFACQMPVTPYRSFPATEVQVSKCNRTIQGIDGIMADTASLHVLLDTLVDREKFPDGKIQFRYTLVTEEAVVAGNQMMARWIMTTTNAVALGARQEVSKQGMLSARFNSSHKVTQLELMFDVMAFMLQLKQAAGAESFCVIPNTVQTCQQEFDKPMVVTMSEPPYTIVRVNHLWEEMTGYSAAEVVGKCTTRVLDGQQTDPIVRNQIMLETQFKRPTSAWVVSYTKTGEMFCHYMILLPLSTDSRITHFAVFSYSHRKCSVVPSYATSGALPPSIKAASASAKPVL